MKVLKIIQKLWVILANNDTKIRYARKMGVTIGEGCTLLGRVEWGSEPYLISIGNQVRITSGVSFVTHDGGMYVLRNKYADMAQADYFGKICIGNNVFIGVNTMILPGVTIGDNVVIGAGSIVTKSIPSNCVACGVPAKQIKGIESYYEKYKTLAVPTKGLPDCEKKREIIHHFSLLDKAD
ncbi:MAG: Galactoside O-acetyltransferase [Firmicutes bacterium ADurb.Bin099]|nr:MAG: Galactoside O-acetyltransferase [Firmicutes bacterium ADurb.Bin099]